MELCVPMDTFYESTESPIPESKPIYKPSAQINGGMQNTINQVQSMEDCRKQLEAVQREVQLYQELLKSKEIIINHLSKENG